MSIASTSLDSALPFHAGDPHPRRHDWIWIAVPIALLAYLWTLLPFGRVFAPASALSALWPLLLILCFSFCLLLLARSWVMRLPGQIARTKPAQFMIGLCGGAVLLATLALPAWRSPEARILDLTGWIFTESIIFLLILGWLKTRSLTCQLAGGEIVAGSSHCAVRDYLMLAKIGLNSLVLFTTFIGFFLATESIAWPLLMRALAGTALVAWGASALNQFMERDVDAMMHRTAVRPLPAGRMTLQQAIGFGVALSVAGLLVLALTVNALTAGIAALTLSVYLFLYTPLKQINSLSTLAGAIAGALPPVIGWTAAGGGFQAPALILFSILFLWQIPHFLAIAWKYRDQYERAGFPLYSVNDPGGRATGLQCVLYTLLLVPISLLLVLFNLSGPAYLILGGTAGMAYLACGVLFFCKPGRLNATRLFFASLLYLPFLFTVLWADHLFIQRFGF